MNVNTIISLLYDKIDSSTYNPEEFARVVRWGTSAYLSDIDELSAINPNKLEAYFEVGCLALQIVYPLYADRLSHPIGEIQNGEDHEQLKLYLRRDEQGANHLSLATDKEETMIFSLLNCSKDDLEQAFAKRVEELLRARSPISREIGECLNQCLKNDFPLLPTHDCISLLPIFLCAFRAGATLLHTPDVSQQLLSMSLAAAMDLMMECSAIAWFSGDADSAPFSQEAVDRILDARQQVADALQVRLRNGSLSSIWNV